MRLEPTTSGLALQNGRLDFDKVLVPDRMGGLQDNWEQSDIPTYKVLVPDRIRGLQENWERSEIHSLQRYLAVNIGDMQEN